MRFFCLKCNTILSGSVQELKTTFEWPKYEFGESIELVGEGYFRVSDGSNGLGQLGDYILNRQDVQNTIENEHWHMGCCGSDGDEGINTSCINGHDIATEFSECYLPKYIVLAKGTVRNA